MKLSKLSNKASSMLAAIGNKLKPSRKGKIILSIAGGFTALLTLMVATQEQHDPNEVDEKSTPVTAVVMTPQSINPELQLYGKLETPNTVTLKTAVTAYVANIAVAEGAKVTKGDLLVVLDDSDAKLAQAQSQANYNDAVAALARAKLQQKAERTIFAHQQKLFKLTEDKLNRQRQLFEDRLVAKQHLDETEREWSLQAINLEQQQLKIANHSHDLTTSQARVALAKAQLDQAQLNLDRTKIRSPFTGRVTGLFAAQGDRLATGMPVIEVFDRESMQVRVALPAEHGRLLSNKESISAVATINGERINLSLIDVAAKVAAGRAGLDGLFKVPDNFEFAQIGRMLPIQITLPAVNNTVAVPVQSLYGNKRIYRVTDDRLEGVEVTRVGERMSDQGVYEVLVSSDQFNPEQHVVITQLPKAVTGLKVEVINAAPADKQDTLTDDVAVDVIAKN